MEGFRWYAKAILMRCVHRNNPTTISSIGHRYTGALNNRGKMEICETHKTFKAIG